MTQESANKIDAGKTMAEMWEGFADEVLRGVPPQSPQFADMKGAFFAGGLCLFNWFMVQMDEDREPTAGDLDKVSTMHAELHGHFLKGQRQ
jgi:hypothetical protein